MRVSRVRISGFKPIPFCASYEEATKEEPLRLEWDDDAFSVDFRMDTEQGPMLHALIGPNSSGKSSILFALVALLNDTTRFKDEDLFNGKTTSQPIIVEVTLVGEIDAPNEWQEEHCVREGDNFRLILTTVWPYDTTRTAYFLSASDNHYHKINKAAKEAIEPLRPQFRLIPADNRLSDEAIFSKQNLLNDLISDLIARSNPDTSVMGRMQELLSQLREMLNRSGGNEDESWEEITELEQLLSDGLAAITPQQNRVRFRLSENIPSAEDVFYGGTLSIDDGVDLNFSQHGLGLQRSFVVSALRTWCNLIRDSEKDYFFAIEEPEIYLHPHATRVLLKIMQDIANEDQVALTTHSSEFVNSVPLQNIYAVSRQREGAATYSRIVQPDLSTLDQTDLVKVQRYLREDRSDMLFARAVLLVEGQSEQFAFPNFARRLEKDLDSAGISVVCVNGNNNFENYVRILQAFDISFVLFADGDNNRAAKEVEYDQFAEHLIVLDDDFEYLIVDNLNLATLQRVCDEARSRIGRNPRDLEPLDRDARVKTLQRTRKPNLGRTIGELLSRDEIDNLTPVTQAIERVMALATGE